MKKVFIGIVSSIMLCLFLESPSIVKADSWVDVGQAYIVSGNVEMLCDLVCQQGVYDVTFNYYGWIQNGNGYNIHYLIPGNVYEDYGTSPLLTLELVRTGYIPDLNNYTVLDPSYFARPFYNDYDAFIDTLPEDLRPYEPTIVDLIWDNFYDLYYTIFGYYPQDDSFIDLLRDLSTGDHSENTVIVFPTLTPTPTPTPIPTPIPVQTIFVPDGNGNTTIIYQYPDPTTGVITQSPYNPNVTNNISVNCNHDGDSVGDNNPFSSSPQDPYTLDAPLFWADGFGVEMSDSPLSAADDSQKTLNAAAEEYNSSVEVLSNSFNILPVKWITLVGLLGGILILAGLLRTFLGG